MARDRDDDIDDRPARRDDDDFDDRPRRRGASGPAEKVPNYLVQSILVTLCCCLPFGIVAILQSAKVNSLAESGNVTAAKEASAAAYKYGMIGAIVGVVVNILAVVVQVLAAGAANQAGR